ncbi:MAG: hypothetical protein PVJ04_01080, partial [Gemmatimonadota bacterium]
MGPNQEGFSARESDVPRRAAAGDPVALTRQMVRIPSVNPAMEADGTGEAALARQAHAWLSEWGFRSELQEVAPGRWNVVASRGERGRR